MKEIELKYFSVLHPVRAFLDDLKQSANASITNVNSLLALQPEPHMIATSSARAALLNLTHSLAHEFTQYGIRVNSILLGMVESAQWKRRYETRSDLNLSWEEWTGNIAKPWYPNAAFRPPGRACTCFSFLGITIGILHHRFGNRCLRWF